MSAEYPYTDELGDTWVGPSLFIPRNKNRGRCFMCGRLTNRVDVNYGAWYCGSFKCDDAIRKDLESR